MKARVLALFIALWFPLIASAAQAPKRLVFKQLFTVGAGQAGKLAKPAREFSPDERTIYVRFVYEGGVPGEELQSRWLFQEPGGAQELAQSALKLEKAADRGQFSFAPPEGSPWPEGSYRVEILGRGGVVGQVEFFVRAPQFAAPPSGTASSPFSIESLLSPGGPAPAGIVTVLNAVFAKDIEKGQPKEPVIEFTTARKRLILWAQTEARNGGVLTARWFAMDGGDRLLGEHALAVPPGQQPVAYWLEVADKNVKFGRGRFRVDLVSDNQVVQQLPFTIREAGFFEELGEAFQQLGEELQKAMGGEKKE